MTRELTVSAAFRLLQFKIGESTQLSYGTGPEHNNRESTRRRLEGASHRLEGLDWLSKRLIVGDPVQTFDDGDHLFMMLPDGKELKTTIIKRTRASQ